SKGEPSVQRGVPDNWREIEDGVIRVIAKLRGRLPTPDLELAESDARAGEWGVALEHMMSQLYEYDVAVPAPIYREIAQLGATMKLDPREWSILRVAEDESS